ncbi:phage/plasmid primase, P4 family [Rhodococcus sp. UFZ-B548]|uniref:DNA primase family protein n=1 Tax=Rhodococcus sp. UFZ-B548 TaxID=2742212 RepID=UPI0015F4311C|nr:DNA primase family protein [Rhodococcus sp. UFZ-B548]
MKLSDTLLELVNGEFPQSLADSNGRLLLDDSPLSAYLAGRMRDQFRHAPGIGWMRYSGKVWKPVHDDRVTKEVQRHFTDMFAEEAPTADGDRRKRLATLLAAHKIRAVKSLLRGLVKEDAEHFDSREHAHLLNCKNGVVDLRTGELLPHDPNLLFTKITACDYVPGKRHKDWDSALHALPDAETADWLQAKLGQAITGEAPSDDVMPLLQGGGQNGKSTILGCRYALGSYAQIVPDKLLISRPSDHPTELMTLRGLRFAILEELPEGTFSVRRLKAILGTSQITARGIGRDNVTWDATHTLVISTNHKPRIYETDHGTWRRLALVVFPWRYRATHDALERETDRVGVDGLRRSIEDGKEQREACLSWLVEGAMRCYAGGDHQRIPAPSARVIADTKAWRGQVDLLALFAEEHLEFDPNACVLSRELYDEFTRWLSAGGHTSWSDQTFTEKLLDHDLAEKHAIRRERKRLGQSQLSRPHIARNAADPKGPQRLTVGIRFQ